MRANFVGMYDSNGNMIEDRKIRYDDIYEKFGCNDSILL
jgi:hypothetical protein